MKRERKRRKGREKEEEERKNESKRVLTLFRPPWLTNQNEWGRELNTIWPPMWSDACSGPTSTILLLSSSFFHLTNSLINWHALSSPISPSFFILPFLFFREKSTKMDISLRENEWMKMDRTYPGGIVLLLIWQMVEVLLLGSWNEWVLDTKEEFFFFFLLFSPSSFPSSWYTKMWWARITRFSATEVSSFSFLFSSLLPLSHNLLFFFYLKKSPTHLTVYSMGIKRGFGGEKNSSFASFGQRFFSTRRFFFLPEHSVLFFQNIFSPSPSFRNISISMSKSLSTVLSNWDVDWKGKKMLFFSTMIPSK